MDLHTRITEPSASKKPRLRHSLSGKLGVACDQCRQHEIQCKFKPAGHDSCPSCMSRGTQCTWTKSAKPQPPPDNSYIEYLEGRVKEMERRLKQMFPGINPKREIESLLGPEPSTSAPSPPGPSVSPSQPHDLNHPSTSTTSRSLPPITTPAAFALIQKARLANVGPQLASTDSRDDNTIWATDQSTNEEEPRYHGQSSAEILSRDAELFRATFGIGNSLPAISQVHRRPEFWQPAAPERRLLNNSPWETEEGLALELPPDDLMHLLFDGFFQHVNVFFPIVHRPLFEKKMEEGLHKRDGTFLRLVLLVCANGARTCQDPRVLDDRWPGYLSAGYKWFRQVQPWHKTFIDQPSLWDVQNMTLMAMFLFGTSAHHGTWMVIGNAIRIMQDIGCHRKKAVVSIENEIHKRCFWSMLLCDRLLSVTLGKPAAIQDLDFDLDSVLEVDDEYWSLEPNAPVPVQPNGVPSRLTMFNQLISLCRVLGQAIQTVFALERTKRQMGLNGPQGDAWMMQEMNVQLGVWARSVPSHLRLPHPNNYAQSPFLTLAVSMWATYYDAVISINQPFVSKHSSPLALSSLQICREAARACACMLDAYRRIAGFSGAPCMFQGAFTSAMVLLVDLMAQGKIEKLAAERGELDLDVTASGDYTIEQKEEDVRRCMLVLGDGETRYHIAGRLHDIIREFEQSWRLQLSPSARSSRSGKSNSPGVDVGQRLHGTHMSPPLFHPSESMAYPNAAASPRVKDEIESEAFDISYSPPPMPEDLKPVHQPETHLIAAEAPHLTYTSHYYGSEHPSAAASDALPSSHHAFSAHRSPTVPFEPTYYPTIPQEESWGEYEHSWSNNSISQLRPYMPGYEYPINNVAQQRQEHLAPSLLPGPSSTSTFRDNRSPLSRTAATIPNLGVVPLGGWMLALNNSPSQAGSTSGGSEGASEGGSVEPKPPLLSQWNAMMQNTLSLNERNLASRRSGKK
ncbi:hypothetical protein BDV93DRAFT_496813 [Ceratobasidium sp. AG-I]|nr:hypothetical protein BDV93DRAFT_496813 [Ceratobasidium sp. AG-I]